MENLPVLGTEEQIVGFTVLGIPSAPELVEIMLEIIEAVGMEPYGTPDVKHFPTPQGKGGAGNQAYICLTESWIMGGTWPDVEPPITRVVLSSCKPYDSGKVAAILTSRIGPCHRQGSFNL